MTDRFYRGLIVQPECHSCPLNGATKVPPEGLLDATIMIVGEGPGSEEEIQGRPFVGRSGLVLNHLLERQGVAREAVYISNATLCKPRATRLTQQIPCPQGCGKSKRKPIDPNCGHCHGTAVMTASFALNEAQTLAEAAKHCRSRLLGEIAYVKPRVVVPLGRHALESLIGKSSGILKHRGGVHRGSVQTR